MKIFIPKKYLKKIQPILYMDKHIKYKNEHNTFDLKICKSYSNNNSMITKTRLKDLKTLDTYNVKNHNTLKILVKQKYETGEIRNITTACRLMNYLQNDNITEFNKIMKPSFTRVAADLIEKGGIKNIRDLSYVKKSFDNNNNSILTKIANKLIKDNNTDELKTLLEIKNRIDKTKFITRVKDEESESPTYEIKFFRRTVNLEKAWQRSIKKMKRLLRNRLEIVNNIKFTISIKLAIYKTDKHNFVYDEKDIYATTYAA